MRVRLHRPLILATVLLAACATDEAPTTDESALTINPPRCWPRTDTTIVNADLKGFTPRTFVDPASQTLELYAVTTSGLSARRFYNKRWHSWRSFGVPSSVPSPAPTSGQSDGWDAAMTILPGPGAAERDAFFGITSGNSAPVVRDRLNLSTGAVQATSIAPPNGVARMSTVTGAMLAGTENVFGNGIPNSIPTTGYATLEEPVQRISGTTTSIIDHASGFSPGQIVGPGGVVALRRNPAVDASDSLYLYAAEALHEGRDMSNNPTPVFFDVVTRKVGDAAWTSLGAPRHVESGGRADPGVIAGAPYAFGFYWGDPSQNAASQLNVFAVARDAHSFQYRLFGRGMSNGNLEADWTEYGVPPTVGVDEPFNLYTGMVFWEGPRYASILRINLWGLTRGGKLIELFWDGYGWQWGQVIATAPDGAVFKGVSSSVVDSGSYKRLSLFVRTTLGTIYEYSWTFDGDTQSGWSWTNLSILEPCTIFVF